ncbi:hypothetical protein ACWCOW_30670 [Streptomyces sp. NPDC001939]
MPDTIVLDTAINSMAEASQSAEGGAVFAAPRDRADQVRMRRAHTAAARRLRVTATGPEVWGWQGRTLGRRADRWWLRLLCEPADRLGGRMWEGSAAAEAALPRSVPRPRLHDLFDWSAEGHTYRAELSEYVPMPALQRGGPALTRELDLPASWWTDLRAALATTATVPTSRVAVSQQWVDKNFTRLLGIPPAQITNWTTGHGDLHWANLTEAPLTLLDWEGWGRLPVGYDIGLLHAYSLPGPVTAARIRAEFTHVLDTPDGRTGELIALAQLLQVFHRASHPFTSYLSQRAEQLTGTPVPTPAERPRSFRTGTQ